MANEILNSLKDALKDVKPNPQMDPAKIKVPDGVSESSGLSESWKETDLGTITRPQESHEVPDKDLADKLFGGSEAPETEPIESPLEEGIQSQETNRMEEIQEVSPYSDEINEYANSPEEIEHYKSVGLEENEINGKPCLTHPDIDPDIKDSMGRTNVERMKSGLAPLDENGKPFELHHIGQEPDSPLAELKQEEHRGQGVYKTLHEKSESSVEHGSGWQKTTADHWRTRASDFE